MSLKQTLTQNPFTIAWIGWIALFFIFEGLAVWSDVQRATLSSHIRDWLSGQATWVVIVAWVFMLALTAHFLVDLNRK